MEAEALLADVVRRSQDRYYGKYRGFVADNQDPERRGRLKLRVPSVLGEAETGWALPCLPFGGLVDQGLFLVPEVEAQIWVEFEEGDVSKPIWTGTFWQTSNDVPTEAAVDPPTTRLLKTVSGHLLQFDDESGKERVLLKHKADARLEIDETGTVALTDKGGGSVTLDADANEIVVKDANGNTMTMRSSGTLVKDSNGNQVEMAAAGITVKGTKVVVQGSQVALGGQGGEPLIKGTSFLTLFATHIHTCTAPGSPSTPPIPQGEMSSLSSTVTTT
ncbi:MAG: phage tail protein [Planctomycetes bacterium]|nr:phage tail protein [Planctomycetota bacterium]